MTSFTNQPGLLRRVPFLKLCVSNIVSILRSPRWYYNLVRALLVSSVPIFLFFYHDPGRHFLWVPDWDVRIVYEALLVNSGIENITTAQFGYGMFFLLAEWFQFLKFVGILEIIDIGSLPLAPASNAVFQELTNWARGLSLILTCVLVVSLMYIAQILTGSRYYGFLAALAFSGTQSLNNLVVHIRAELPSAAFAYIAVLFILMAIKRNSTQLSSLLFLAGSAFCALVSMYSKVSSMPIILLLPLFPLVFESVLAPKETTPSKSISTGLLSVLIILAVVAGYLSLGPFFMTMGAEAYLYNGAIVIYVVGCIVVFCRQRRLSVVEMAIGGAMVILGLAVAQLILLGFDPYSQSLPISNHLDALLSAADNTKGESIGTLTLIGQIILKLGSNIWQVISDSVFNFCWVCRRARMIYLLGFITLAVVWWKYDGSVRFRATFLFLTLIFIEAILLFHNFNNFYRMYVEGLLMAVLAYNVVRISYASSRATKRGLAVFSLIFACWFSVDDVERKMLWPSFASHVGITLPNIEKMPHVADRFRSYVQEETERARKIKAGILPRTSQPRWWKDDRNFLGAGKPWREWPN
jgi:hypothetical protein